MPMACTRAVGATHSIRSSTSPAGDFSVNLTSSITKLPCETASALYCPYSKMG